MNNEKMLADNLRRAESFKTMTAREEDDLFKTASELSDYVCRQCGKCSCTNGIDIMEIFAAEGFYDRQMARGIVQDTADYALMERLRFWYQDQELGKKRYENLAKKGNECNKCGKCLPMCPYSINIPEKLTMADYKLAAREIY
jgi:predicted aldo/keto reductase-like oxidoreductase